MPELTVNAFAKLNLSLDILRKRDDGYHDLRMVMQSVSLCDTLHLRIGKNEGILCETNVPYLPTDGRNLAVKAANAFFDATALENPGLLIRIEKRIPACAGMAGGSSDGAAVLRALRTLLAPALPMEELERIGLSVGSDVPYCIRGTTALAEGRGERLRDLSPLPPCWFVICKPDFPISTPELFARVRLQKLRFHPDTKGMLCALGAGDLTGVARRVFNVFEEVLPPKYHEVQELKKRLLEQGALNAAMTGSGPTVFGLFAREDAARQAERQLRHTCRQVFLAEPIPGGLNFENTV